MAAALTETNLPDVIADPFFPVDDPYRMAYQQAWTADEPFVNGSRHEVLEEARSCIVGAGPMGGAERS